MTEYLTLGLPFFFMLAIVYGALEVGGVFKNKAAKMIIAVVVAAFSLMNAGVVALINQAMPYAAVFFIAVFFLGFVKKAFKAKEGKHTDWALVIIVVGLLLIVFARQGESFRDFFDRGPLSYENFLIVIAVVIMLLMFYAAYNKKQ